MTDNGNHGAFAQVERDAGVSAPAKRRLSLPKFLSPLFLLAVVLPTILAVVYFGFLASNVYISESRFVVRSPTRTNISPLGAVLSGSSFGGASEEATAVGEYLISRRALYETDRDGLLSRAYGAANIGWIDRFGGWRGTSREDLYDYFLDRVEVDNETSAQVTRLTVRAFKPEDAQAINTRLLQQAEALVNRLATRARSDSIEIAQTEVDEAQADARIAAVKLATLRNSAGIIDPEQQAAIQLQMISKLQDELISARTQMQQLRVNAPQASQIAFLRSQISSLENEIAAQTALVTGGNRSYSNAAVRFQELQLENELAAGQLEIALASLKEAQTEARRKLAYVERISDPSLPDDHAQPRRLRGILATLLLGLIAWGVLSTLIVGIREHRD